MDPVPTPCVVVDERVADANIKRMAEYAVSQGLNLRPHIKTHKSKTMAAKQLAAGAIGLTVAKVGEAEVMSEVCDDILMAYPSVGEERCRRLAKLAGAISLRVGLDSRLAAETLSAKSRSLGTTVGILIDFDLGYGRTGVQSIEDSISLAQEITKLPGLRLDGIMLYTGHVMGDSQTQTNMMAELQTIVSELVQSWHQQGLTCEIISSGSTPSAFHSHLLTDVTEIRPGTYIYNDMNTIRGQYSALSDSAAKIHATVISNTVSNQVVIDAGSKTLTSDLCGPAPDSGFGFVVEYPASKIHRLTEEHGQVDVSKSAQVPALGERITIIPNHICVCMNMQNGFWLQKDDHFSRQSVDARGLLI